MSSSKWGSAFGNAGAPAPTPDEQPAETPKSKSSFANAFGPSTLSPVPAASAPRAQPGLVSDEAAAAMKAKAAETSKEVAEGLSQGATIATAKAKALREQGATHATALIARLRRERLSVRFWKASGGVVVLAALAVAGIEWHAHKSIEPAPAPTVAAVKTPAPPVVAPIAVTLTPVVPSVAPVTQVPAATAPVTAPAVPAAQAAPATCAFTGTVQTADGSLISGATVMLNPKGDFRLPVTTAVDGAFAFTNPTSGGTYALQVQATGYRTERVGVAACAAGRAVVLTPLAVVAASAAVATKAPVRSAPKAAKKPVERVKPAWEAGEEAKAKAWFDARKAAQDAGGH